MVNGLPLKQKDIILSFFETASKYCISDSLVDHNGYSISSKGFLATEVVDIMKRRHEVAAKSKVYLALYKK